MKSEADFGLIAAVNLASAEAKTLSSFYGLFR